MHGGLAKTELATENIEALKKGMTNLAKHIENIQKFGLPIVVGYKCFPYRYRKSTSRIKSSLRIYGRFVSISEAWAKRWRRCYRPCSKSY